LSVVTGLLREICHALSAAHRVGVVHRDLKPENIFLATSQRASVHFTVKILDFGISKMVSDAKTTSTGAMGSPMWMAPEQSSRASVVGPQTDVWALGLIAFYLLTGRYFWRAADDKGGSLAELMREVVLDPIPPASKRAAEYDVPLPPGFEGWFARVTTRDPGARLPDATEAYSEFLRATGGQPLSAPPPTTPRASSGRPASVSPAVDELGPTIDAAAAQAAPPPSPSASTVAAITDASGPGGTTQGFGLAVRGGPRGRSWGFVAGGVALVVLGGLGTWLALDRGRAAAVAKPPASSPSANAMASESASPSAVHATAVSGVPVTPSAAASDTGPPGHGQWDRTAAAGEDVFILVGDLSFKRGHVSVARSGKVLVGDTEYDDDSVSPATVPTDWTWQEGDVVLHDAGPAGITCGVVTHVRLDGQLSVRAWDGKYNLQQTFAPPGTSKVGQLPLASAVPVRSAWLPRLKQALRSACSLSPDCIVREAEQAEHERCKTDPTCVADEQRHAAAAASAAATAAAVEAQRRLDCVKACYAESPFQTTNSCDQRCGVH
jgi:hypothetical protein